MSRLLLSTPAAPARRRFCYPSARYCYWAAKWQADGSTETMHDQLRDRLRVLAGRKVAPTAAIIDSQSVRAAEEVARSATRPNRCCGT